MGLIVLIIIAVVLFLFGLTRKSMERKASRASRGDVSVEAYWNGVDITDRLFEYSIAGINYRNLNDGYLGDFVGEVKMEENNQYDPKAVAVYAGGKKVGYIPRGENIDVYDKLAGSNGTASCRGYIGKGVDEEDGHEFFYGKVTIDW